MRHTSEWCYACTGADKKNFLFNIFRQSKNANRPTQSNFRSFFYFIEKIMRAGTIIKLHNTEFKHIGTIGPACYRITAPAFVRLFMNRQIQRYKLAGFKIKYFQLRNLYKKTAGSFCLLFNFYNLTNTPWFYCHKK